MRIALRAHRGSQITHKAGLLAPDRHQAGPGPFPHGSSLRAVVDDRKPCIRSNRMHAGYSCGGSAGICPERQHRLPVSPDSRTTTPRLGHLMQQNAPENAGA